MHRNKAGVRGCQHDAVNAIGIRKSLLFAVRFVKAYLPAALQPEAQAAVSGTAIIREGNKECFPAVLILKFSQQRVLGRSDLTKGAKLRPASATALRISY